MENKSIPVWYWIIVSLLLIWNIMGMITLTGQVTLTKDAMDLMSPEEQQFYMDMPQWVTLAFGLAVFGGFFGCIALLARRKWARYFLIASLIGVIAQISYNIILGGGLDVFGGYGLILPIFTLVIAIFLVWLSEAGLRKGWLR